MCIRDRAYAARNPAALAQLVAAGAQVRALPRSVMDAAFEASLQVYKDLSEKDPKFKAIHDNYMGSVSYTHLDVYKRQSPC